MTWVGMLSMFLLAFRLDGVSEYCRSFVLRGERALRD